MLKIPTATNVVLLTPRSPQAKLPSAFVQHDLHDRHNVTVIFNVRNVVVSCQSALANLLWLAAGLSDAQWRVPDIEKP